jgi:hypothetical protein
MAYRSLGSRSRRTEPLAMTTRDFLFLMVVFPLAIILGIVAFVGLQEMAMLEMNDLGGAFPLSQPNV